FHSTSSVRRNSCSRAMWSTNSRPFNRPRNGLHWRRRSKTTLSLVIRPSRHSSEANPHPDHARARRRAEGEGAFKISLDVRNKNLSEKRIHQISNAIRRNRPQILASAYPIELTA